MNWLLTAADRMKFMLMKHYETQVLLESVNAAPQCPNQVGEIGLSSNSGANNSGNAVLLLQTTN